MTDAWSAGDDSVVGPPYEDADGVRYLPMLRQPVLVFEAAAEKLRTVHRRALERDASIAIYTSDLFATGHDDDNRAAVQAVATTDLNLVGLAVRAPHRTTDPILRGLRRHPNAYQRAWQEMPLSVPLAGFGGVSARGGGA